MAKAGPGAIVQWAEMLQRAGLIENPNDVSRVEITIDAREGVRMRVDHFVDPAKLASLLVEVESTAKLADGFGPFRPTGETKPVGQEEARA